MVPQPAAGAREAGREGGHVQQRYAAGRRRRAFPDKHGQWPARSGSGLKHCCPAAGGPDAGQGVLVGVPWISWG
ncbi:hypothetical protein GCM10010221_17000 [Streptomyces parvus]|nr:hypothetical protein GCM10010221_17000 [Streptomyces parvus]